MNQTKEFCLASASPRRKSLLAECGFRCQVEPADVDETPLPDELPKDYVQRVSWAKVEKVSKQHPQKSVLGGDTIVSLKDKIYGKPASPEEAADMLRQFSNNTHRVYSGYALWDAEKQESRLGVDYTEVTFWPLPEKWINFYSQHPEPQDKSGSYALQGLGQVMVKNIQGAASTVLGFPMHKLYWEMMELEWIV